MGNVWKFWLVHTLNNTSWCQVIFISSILVDCCGICGVNLHFPDDCGFEQYLVYQLFNHIYSFAEGPLPFVVKKVTKEKSWPLCLFSGK